METQEDLGFTKYLNRHEKIVWPTIFYFYPDDIEALYSHMADKGFSVTPLEITFYGMKEFSVQDPDGHLLSFGEDVDETAEKC